MQFLRVQLFLCSVALRTFILKFLKDVWFEISLFLCLLPVKLFLYYPFHSLVSCLFCM